MNECCSGLFPVEGAGFLWLGSGACGVSWVRGSRLALLSLFWNWLLTSATADNVLAEQMVQLSRHSVFHCSLLLQDAQQPSH